MAGMPTWVDDAVRGAALPALVALATSCSTTGPVESLPPGAVPMEAPESYLAWWEATESCAGLGGSFGRVEWFVVPGVNSFSTEVGEKVGLWVKRGERRTITIAGGYLEHEMVVRHEMLHDLLSREGHPEPYFTERCGLTWETWQGTPSADLAAGHLH
jgi:hypothetical protein